MSTPARTGRWQASPGPWGALSATGPQALAPPRYPLVTHIISPRLTPASAELRQYRRTISAHGHRHTRLNRAGIRIFHAALHGQIQRYPTPAHHLPARSQCLDLPPGPRSLAGPGGVGRLPLQQDSRPQRAPDHLAAGSGGAPLRRGRARRLPAAPEGRHLDGARAGARGHRTAQPLGHAGRVRPDARDLAARRVPHGVPLPRRGRGPRGAGAWPPSADGRHQ